MSVQITATQTTRGDVTATTTPATTLTVALTTRGDVAATSSPPTQLTVTTNA